MKQLLPVLFVLVFSSCCNAEPLPRPGWPLQLETFAIMYRQNIVSYDLNNNRPVIAASTFHHVFLTNLQGEYLEGWPLDFSPFIVAAGPLIGDVDGDGDSDIIVALTDPNGTNLWRSIVKLSYDGRIDSSFTKTYEFPTGWRVASSPVLADLNGDAVDEIIYCADSLYAVFGNGESFRGFPWNCNGQPDWLASPVVGANWGWNCDVIIWATNTALHARCIGEENELPGWPVENLPLYPYHNSSPVLIPDSLNHGWIVAIGTADSIWAFDQDAQRVSGFPVQPANTGVTKQLYFLSAGDVDGNGNPELLFKLNNNQLHAIDLRGQYLEGFPITVSDNGLGEPVTCLRRTDESFALLFCANMPNTRRIQEVIGLRSSSILEGYPVSLDLGVESASGSVALIPPFDDTLHIVHNLNSGRVMVWDEPMEGNGVYLEWGCSGSTAKGNPVYHPGSVVAVGERDHSTLPSEIQVAGVYPNPSNGGVYVPIRNGNSPFFDVAIYNLLGRLIWEENHFSAAGETAEILWPAVDMNGNSVSSGVYLIKVGDSRVRRAVILR